MRFDFFYSGIGVSYLAFTPPPPGSGTDTPHLLLVSDWGHDAVHIVDVVSRTHVGYVAAPRTIAGPCGVAASGAASLVAISTWKERFGDQHMVHIYRAGSSRVHWTHVRVIGSGIGKSDGHFNRPFGLRFSADGSAIYVADMGNHRVSLFRVGDGGFVRHVATGLVFPRDVEEVEGGWAVACWGSDTVEFVRDGGQLSLGNADGGYSCEDGEFYYPTAVALVPGLGLIVREWENSGRLQVFSTPDLLAMRAMTVARVGWMIATYRAVVNRQSLLDGKRR